MWDIGPYQKELPNDNLYTNECRAWTQEYALHGRNSSAVIRNKNFIPIKGSFIEFECRYAPCSNIVGYESDRVEGLRSGIKTVQSVKYESFVTDPVIISVDKLKPFCRYHTLDLQIQGTLASSNNDSDLQVLDLTDLNNLGVTITDEATKGGLSFNFQTEDTALADK